MKKLFAILLATLLAVSIPFTAIAATGNLTIHGTIEGKTYDLYRVFDLTWSAGSPDDHYSYTVNTDFAGYFTGKKHCRPRRAS